VLVRRTTIIKSDVLVEMMGRGDDQELFTGFWYVRAM
jgi:hypothetical protein